MFLVELRKSMINPSLRIAGLQSEISTQDLTNTKVCYPLDRDAQLLHYKMSFKHGDPEIVLPKPHSRTSSRGNFSNDKVQYEL
jgi:hypothetical protein